MAGTSERHKKMENIPMRDIREFLSDQQAEPSFQYHEIQGRTTIEKFHTHDFFLF